MGSQSRAVAQEVDARLSMRIQRIELVFCILAIFLPVFQSKPGHMVHDYYKCASDYYRKNFKHCKEAEAYNSRRGRGLEGQYSSAHSNLPNSSHSILLGLAAVLASLNRF